MVKLAILDVDGTITDSSRRIQESAITAIRKAQDNGKIISLVSGNVVPVMYALQVYIGIKNEVFAENGGVMYFKNKIEKFFHKRKTDEFLTHISKISSARGIFTNVWRYSSMAFEMDSEDVEKVRAESIKWNLDITDSSFSWHVLNKGQNKGYALKKLIELHNVEKEDVLVVGDSKNDLPMFVEDVNRSTVKNGDPGLKELSDYISPRGLDEAIPDIFRKFSLI
ncbi:phosphoglycolate phosphatase [Oxyplasma meridianum]|uniref:Phosphoglycolate phosphatase n=1 Tax=Oxyplasma meridianum TaxID=3073602 RepID=A0AAX4NIA6_9ARCH